MNIIKNVRIQYNTCYICFNAAGSKLKYIDNASSESCNIFQNKSFIIFIFKRSNLSNYDIAFFVNVPINTCWQKF